MAQYGIRSGPKSRLVDAAPAAEEREKYIVYDWDPAPYSKELTFNERVIFSVFVFGILAMCWRNKYPDGCKQFNYCFGFCKREKRSPDALEAEFDFKVKKEKYGFEINMSSDSEDEDKEEEE